MNFVYGFLVGALLGGAAIWIYKVHMLYEARKALEAAQEKVVQLGDALKKRL